MKLSHGDVIPVAESTGFSPVMVEKVILLMNLLSSFNTHPSLKGKWVLKGGTALNLFVFKLPRLSVDIDLNYVGFLDREMMLEDRPIIEKAVQAVCLRENLRVKQVPTDHAGGKWILSYQSYTGQRGNLEVDFNYMFRQPLVEPISMSSNFLGTYRALDIPVLDLHELAAGKLAALLARTQARDLIDSWKILSELDLDPLLLRLSFAVYGGMNRIDWRTVTADTITFDPEDLTRKLLPVLGSNALSGQTPRDFGEQLANSCRKAISVVLPLNDNEMEFLDRLLENGEIVPGLLSSDTELQDRIYSQPLLRWKAMNVCKHKVLRQR